MKAYFLILLIGLGSQISLAQGLNFSESKFTWKDTPEILKVSGCENMEICVAAAQAEDAKGNSLYTQIIACKKYGIGRCPSAQECFEQKDKQVYLIKPVPSSSNSSPGSIEKGQQ